MFAFLQARKQDGLPFVTDAQQINKIIGYIALGLPFALGLTAWRTNSPFMYSISHFYYTRIGGDLLVGALGVIGVALLLFYRYQPTNGSEPPAHSWWNARWANLAGACALGVAFFPTGDWGVQYPVPDAKSDLTSRFFLTETQASGSIYDENTVVDGTVTHDFWLSFEGWDKVNDVPWVIYNSHYLSAAGMFLILGYFAFFVFTRAQDEKARIAGQETFTDVKKLRNLIYRISGIVVFGSVLGLAVKMGVVNWVHKGDKAAQTAFLEPWNELHLTFYLESLALIAFGIAWMVKGRFISWLNDADAQPTSASLAT